MKHYEHVLSHSKLNYDPSMVLRHRIDTHIDFIIPDNDIQKESQYTSFIARECRLRGIHIDVRDGVEEWQTQLRASIALESRNALGKLGWREDFDDDLEEGDGALLNIQEDIHR